MPKPCLVVSARASGLLSPLPQRALWWICSVWLLVIPGPWAGMMLICPQSLWLPPPLGTASHSIHFLCTPQPGSAYFAFFLVLSRWLACVDLGKAFWQLPKDDFPHILVWETRCIKSSQASNGLIHDARDVFPADGEGDSVVSFTLSQWEAPYYYIVIEAVLCLVSFKCEVCQDFDRILHSEARISRKANFVAFPSETVPLEPFSRALSETAPNGVPQPCSPRSD